MKRAAIYTRISKDLRDGAGIHRQLEACQDLVTTRGYSLAGTYSDNDISAYSGKPRPEFDRLLKDSQAGAVDVIVCWHTDRLYRRLADLVPLLDACKNRDIDIQTVQGGEVDLSTASGRMIASILGSVAAGEVDHQIERQRAAHADRAARGMFRGGPVPFGFKTIRGKPGYLEHDPEKAEALKYAADAILDGESIKSIARKWVEMGVAQTNTNHGAKGAHVRRRLLHSRIAGLEPYKGEIYPATTYEAIIPEAKWRAVKAVLEDKSRLTHSGQERKYLLVGIAKCGVCGAGMNTLKRGKVPEDNTRSYVCPMCTKISRRVVPVDELVEKVVLGYLNQPENRISIAARAAPPGVDLQELLEEQTALMARQSELSTLFVDRDITADQLRTGTARLDDKLQRLRRRIAAASESSPLAALVLQDDSLEARWAQLGITQRSQVIDELVTITILPNKKHGRHFDPTRIRIEWK